jgi:hypothetical protein
VRNIFLYNTDLKQLLKVDINQSIENMISDKVTENNKIKSIYSDILSQNNLTNAIFENSISSNSSDEEIKIRFKTNDEIKDYQDQLSFVSLLGQKDEFYRILKNYMGFLVKNKVYCQIIDLSMDMLRLNSEFYFYNKVNLIIFCLFFLYFLFIFFFRRIMI